MKQKTAKWNRVQRPLFVLRKCSATVHYRAQDWIRTSTPMKAPPPQSGLSTNFNTWAIFQLTSTYFINSGLFTNPACRQAGSTPGRFLFTGLQR